MHRDLEGGPSIVCRGRAHVAASFMIEKQARHSCQAALLTWIPLIGLFQKIVSAAERKSSRISVCGRMLIGHSSQRVWLGFQLQSGVAGVQIQPAYQILDV